MNIHTCTDQLNCRHTLALLRAEEVFRPLPGNITCDGIIQLDVSAWIVGTNEAGRLTLHMLEDATKEEAWAFFDALHGGGHKDQRLVLCGQGAQHAQAN